MAAFDNLLQTQSHSPKEQEMLPLNKNATQPEDWEIYAWALREIMSKASGLPQVDQQQREKLVYEEKLGYYKPRPRRTESSKLLDTKISSKASDGSIPQSIEP